MAVAAATGLQGGATSEVREGHSWGEDIAVLLGLRLEVFNFNFSWRINKQIMSVC